MDTNLTMKTCKRKKDEGGIMLETNTIDLFNPEVPVHLRLDYLLKLITVNPSIQVKENIKAMLQWMIENNTPSIPLRTIFGYKKGLEDLRNPNAVRGPDIGDLKKFVCKFAPLAPEVYDILDRCNDLAMVYMGVRSWEPYHKSEEEFLMKRFELGIGGYWDDAWLYNIAIPKGISKANIRKFLEYGIIYVDCNI